MLYANPKNFSTPKLSEDPGEDPCYRAAALNPQHQNHWRALPTDRWAPFPAVAASRSGWAPASAFLPGPQVTQAGVAVGGAALSTTVQSHRDGQLGEGEEQWDIARDKVLGLELGCLVLLDSEVSPRQILTWFCPHRKPFNVEKGERSEHPFQI